MPDVSDRRKRGESAGIDWSAQPLGAEPDGVIAARLGVSQTAVALARKRRGIASAPKPPSTPRPSKWDGVVFGVEPDAVLAKRLGTTTNAVAVQRARRGIPPVLSHSPRRVAWFVGLPHAAQVEALRELLRAAPDAAVEAVDSCKVARAWEGCGTNEVRYPLGRGGGVGSLGHTAFVGPLGAHGAFALGEWLSGRPNGWGRTPDRGSAREASDAAWTIDGWVLAGVARG